MNVSVLRTSFIHVAADPDLTVGATDCRPFGPRERRKTVFRPIRAKHLRRDGQRTGPRLLPFDHRLSRPFFGAVGLLSWGLLGPLGLHAMQPVLTLMRNRGQSAVFRWAGVIRQGGAPWAGGFDAEAVAHAENGDCPAGFAKPGTVSRFPGGEGGRGRLRALGGWLRCAGCHMCGKRRLSRRFRGRHLPKGDNLRSGINGRVGMFCGRGGIGIPRALSVFPALPSWLHLPPNWAWRKEGEKPLDKGAFDP
jgi:hypothetical protein